MSMIFLLISAIVVIVLVLVFMKKETGNQTVDFNNNDFQAAPEQPETTEQSVGEAIPEMNIEDEAAADTDPISTVEDVADTDDISEEPASSDEKEEK